MNWLCTIGLHRWMAVQRMEYGDLMPDGTGLRYISRWCGHRVCVRCGKRDMEFDQHWDPHTGAEAA